MTRLPWYWDEMAEIYTPQQVEWMRYRKDEERRLPNVVGLPAMDAYNKLNNAGFIVRMIYTYDPNCKYPEGYCKYPEGYCKYQDVKAGLKWSINCNFHITIQGPASMGQYCVERKANDDDFSLDEEVIKQNKIVKMPNLMGMTETQARKALSNLGFQYVSVSYQFEWSDAQQGTCVYQSEEAGKVLSACNYVSIVIQDIPAEMRRVPNVMGMQEADAAATLRAAGFHVDIIYIEWAGTANTNGECVFQCEQKWTQNKTVEIHIMRVPEPTPDPTPEPPPVEPTPDPTPEPPPVEPTPTVTPVPTDPVEPTLSSTQTPSISPTETV